MLTVFDTQTPKPYKARLSLACVTGLLSIWLSLTMLQDRCERIPLLPTLPVFRQPYVVLFRHMTRSGQWPLQRRLTGLTTSVTQCRRWSSVGLDPISRSHRTPFCRIWVRTSGCSCWIAGMYHFVTYRWKETNPISEPNVLRRRSAVSRNTTGYGKHSRSCRLASNTSSFSWVCGSCQLGETVY
jgi:hypothetical protein